jgi:hypothetical protein
LTWELDADVPDDDVQDVYNHYHDVRHLALLTGTSLRRTSLTQRQAIWEYAALLKKLAAGLSQKDVAYWVGAIFRSMLNAHKRYFEVSLFPVTSMPMRRDQH